MNIHKVIDLRFNKPDYKNECGIYGILCLISLKLYIGYTKNFSLRRRCHKSELNKNKHGNIHLQNAWNKYGEENFIFLIIENCSFELLRKREHYWCKKLKVHDRNIGYNIDPTSESNNRLMSEETRKKISIANTGRRHSIEFKENLSKIHKGKKQSKEIIEKRVAAIKNLKKNKTFLKKQAAKLRGKKVTKVKSINPLTGEEIFYNSVMEASRLLGIIDSTIHNALKGRSKTAKKLIWKYQ